MKRISLTYKGIRRVVEPHAYGVSLKGSELLRCYQTCGGHESARPHNWALLTVSKITSLSVLEEGFSSPRDGYRRGDEAMSTIYAQL
jgi:hypothetical protein